MSARRAQPYSKQPSRAAHIADAEWARIRDEFRELYMTKGWTLSKAQKHLQKHMGFHAT